MERITASDVLNKKIRATVLVALFLLFTLTYFVLSTPPQQVSTPSVNGNGAIPIQASSVIDALSSGEIDPVLADPQVTVYGNSTYVVWRDNSTGNDEIYAKMSPAGKTDFGRTFNLSRNNGSSADPQVTVYGNSTYVVWRDNSTGNDEIYAKMSPAGKTDFGRTFNLSRNNGSSADPQVTVYGNSTYVVWRDNSTGNDEIYAKMSPAGKTDFGRTFYLSRNNGSSADPQVTVYGNSTYVVWRDNSTGNDEIYAKMSPAGKTDFGRTFNLSRNNGSSADPQVTVYGNSTYVVWRDNSTGNDEIYAKMSPAGKTDFGRTFYLSRNNGSSADPQVTVYGNSTYVVWRDNSTGNDEIYAKMSPAGKTDFGRTFNLSRNNGSSADPQVTVYGNSTYVVWRDNSTGEVELIEKAVNSITT